VKSIVERIFYPNFIKWLESHPEEAKMIVNKAVTAMKAREAAKKAKELVLARTSLRRSLIPGKLADCITNNPDEAELFIVEGESAGGSAKQGRDRHFQAILSLKGKIINAEKASVIKVLKNEEIKNIIQAIGAGFGKEFDVNKVRYKKIIIMTDADVDGSHIRTLLLAFFYRFMRPLIEKGYLYIAQPPLYKIWKGKTIKYAYTEKEKEEILKEMPDANVQRYKGLGEMNPEQLWETTMDPKNRRLKQVTIEQAEEAERLISVLLGKEVKPRREFIVKHALEVKELDI
jgi:DNA gyrase subunit B